MNRNLGAGNLRRLVTGVALVVGLHGATAILAQAGGGEIPDPAVVGEAGKEEPRLSVERIVAAVTTAGFREILKVEHEHGLYEVDARDPAGHRVELFVDPATGDLVLDPATGKPRTERLGEAKQGKPPVPYEDIVSQVKAEGYAEVYAIEHEHGLYEIKVRDAEGGKVELFLHPKDGKLLRHRSSGEPIKEGIDD